MYSQRIFRRNEFQSLRLRVSADKQLLKSAWFRAGYKTLEVDSDYEEWKEKIRIIITSFSAAAAGKHL